MKQVNVTNTAENMKAIHTDFYFLFSRCNEIGIGATKSFMRTMNDAFILDLNARKIKEVSGMNIYNWFAEGCFAFGEDYSLFNLTNASRTEENRLSEAEFIDVVKSFNAVINKNIVGVEPKEKKVKEPKKQQQQQPIVDVEAEMISEVEKQIKNEIQEMQTEQKPTEVKHQDKQTEAKFMLNFDLSSIVDAAVSDYINSSDIIKNIRTYIQAEAQKLQPTIVQFGEIKSEGKVEGRLHQSFNEAVRICASERTLWMAGEAGTGKTTLAKQVSKALNLDFGFISCSAGMSEGHLLGRMTAHGDYLPSRFIEIYENGGVFLFDEIDAADSNTLLVINSALANGLLSVPSRVSKPYAEVHKDFICIVASNTWGNGSVNYSGRGSIDAATKDRFCGSKILVGYDEALELEIAGEFKNDAKKLHKLRKNCADNKIRKIVSTRSFVSLARQRKQNITFAQFIDIFTADWTNEERTKAMDGINLS